MEIAIALLLLLCAGAGFLLLHRRSKSREAELTAVIAQTATDRNKQMAPFHVARFTAAVEQCEKPDLLPEYQRNLRYWQAVMAAEEMRP